MSESVFILEDHDGTAKRLQEAIAGDQRLTLAGRANSLAGARSWWSSQTRSTAVLVDLGLPDGSGIDFIRQICTDHKPPVVLVITVFGDEKHVVSAIEAGAMGYLLKDSDPLQISDSICSVLAGGSPMSPSIARFLLKRFHVQEPEAPSIALTAREREVLQLVVKGYSYKELADSLSLSIHTVTSHIQHIYRKLAVRSRGEAVFEALQLGLVDVS